jgi:hypothetical protein
LAVRATGKANGSAKDAKEQMAATRYYMTTHVCAAGMAFLGFGCALVIGLSVGNPFVTVVTRGVVVLVAFYGLGFVLGSVGQKVVQDDFDKQANALRTAQDAAQDATAEPTEAQAGTAVSGPAAPQTGK